MKFQFVLLLYYGVFSQTHQVHHEYISPDSIPELQYLNPQIDPCDNFYEYTCGNFKNINPIPEGKYNWDHFTILQDEIHGLMRLILESPRKQSDPIALQKAKAAYSSCLDVDYLDMLKMPQQEVMKEMGIWPLLAFDGGYYGIGEEIDFNKVGEIVAKYGVPLFFKFQVVSDYFEAENNTIYLSRDALSNPQTYYPKFEQNLEDYLEKQITRSTRSDEVLPFEEFLRKMALHLRNVEGTWRNDDDIKSDISETINFMVKLQSGGIPNANLSQLTSIATISELQEWTNQNFGDKSINWIKYLQNLFAPSKVKIVDSMKIMYSPYLVYGVLNLFHQTEQRILKNFIMVRLFTYMAPDSSKFMREAFDTYYRKQNYDVFPRWEYCLRKIIGYPNRIDYSMALTYEYQRYHFNINKLSAAADLVDDLMAAFEDMLEEAEWIDAKTRGEALLKLEYMYTLLGYPDYAENAELLDEYYDDLRVCTWEHFGNSQRSRSFEQSKNFELIEKERSREVWNLSPLEVNAFYNRPNNRILFPVSMLNSVFFSGNISTLDYGRIGAIIGHEITHGYDNEGRSYNRDGVLSGWWTEETEAAFNEKTQCFLEQYQKYYIEELGVYVNSSLTLNENIADNGGLRQAYKALQKLQKKSSSIKTTANFTTEQLFFIGYGTMWCMAETDYYLQQMHKTSNHAPGRFRVNGVVSNMPEFADAFNCPLDSNMNPANKCVLW
nr:neprilysin-11-like [Onthophagus taurus]